MGIRLGYNWRFEIARGIGGPDPYYTARLRKREQERLLEVARSTSFGYCVNEAAIVERSVEQCARDYAVVAIMLDSGLFLDQVASLMSDAITTQSADYSISYVDNHGAQRQHRLLSTNAAEAVRHYLSITSRAADCDTPLFLAAENETTSREALTAESIGQIVVGLMREVPLQSERGSPYTLRNTFAKTWMDIGRDRTELQQILDLDTDRVMDAYLGCLEDNLANAVEEESAVGDWKTNLLQRVAITHSSNDPIACLRRIEDGSGSYVAALPTVTGDVFLCCVSQDEVEVALPLARELLMSGLRVRLSRYSLGPDDTLDQAMAEGFTRCSYGVVIVSRHFIDTKFSSRELSALFAGVKPGSVLPVWRDVTHDEVRAFHPIIATLQAVKTEDGIAYVAFKISLEIRRASI